MSTVYVVTSGEYSDYGIDGVFSTKELAAKYIREYNECYNNSGRFNDVEEWVLDAPSMVKAIRRPFWEVTINLIDGTINNYNVNAHEYTSEEFPNKTPVEELNTCRCLYQYFIVKSYKGLEHAQKLAAEYRQELLRVYPMDKWDTTDINNYIVFKGN